MDRGVEFRWDELRRKIQGKWAELSEEEIAMAAGHRDEFIGKVKAKYGDSADGIRRQFHEWAQDFSDGRRLN